MQEFRINLDGGELPVEMLRHGDVVECDRSVIEFALLNNATVGGNHGVALFAKLPDGRTAMIEITAQNFLHAASAVRGRYTHLGIIHTDVDPALAIMADRDKRTVHFAFEVPMQSWDYTIPHAKAFWRQLKQMTEGL